MQNNHPTTEPFPLPASDQNLLLSHQSQFHNLYLHFREQYKTIQAQVADKHYRFTPLEKRSLLEDKHHIKQHFARQQHLYKISQANKRVTQQIREVHYKLAAEKQRLQMLCNTRSRLLSKQATYFKTSNNNKKPKDDNKDNMPSKKY